ncbi:hypothetical protein GTZ97_02605 [Aquabacterium fontiphilum]|uniref:YybH family protein n=1 Tax=Aquabacterium fontiphilum TaxID=450365 RepID=UPI001377055A|nr:nuclear transport factor 2 family protein [Aquabacterium fontiphilum]NBD19565.1 hypothetical protein [Aquabacterium fontiphilum]
MENASMMSFDELPADVREWLTTWEQHIRQLRFDEAEQLFDVNVHSYGTVMSVVTGRPALVAHQWRAVWPRTRGFRFVPESIKGWGCHGLFSIAAQWSSEGLDAHSGEPFQREGRATMVLHELDGRWHAVHTHLSINPAPEPFLQ